MNNGISLDFRVAKRSVFLKENDITLLNAMTQERGQKLAQIILA